MSHFKPCRLFSNAKTIAPVKGAQVPKVGRWQRRLSQKPKFVFFFWKPFLTGKSACGCAMTGYCERGDARIGL